MDREIKFRAWDKEKSRMSKPFYLGALALEWSDGDIDMPLPFAFAKAQSRERFIFIQFTGLHNKDDKEIYEGDIVKYIATVKNYDDDDASNPRNHNKFQFSNRTWVSAVKYKAPSFFISFDCDWKKLEVIGNIYSTPDLLK